MKNNIVGQVLWWSDRDEHGIIVDTKGNEYYFDRSVTYHKPTRKDKVQFEINTKIKDCLCARNVQLILDFVY